MVPLTLAQSYLTIHGHFYQPSRENPWTGIVEEQTDAAPFHDWNQLINSECYQANAFAPILDDQDRVTDVVNNFSLTSFDVGPTLFFWMERYDPITYRRIIEGDRLSLARLGHGNALATTYNHPILPLANDRDKATQVVWGLKDFKARYGRDPQGFWLPETAVDYPTLSVLAEAGIRFTILSPAQALRVRPLGKESWQQVTTKDLDTTRPYRCFTKDGSRRYIDLFFYHGAISRGIAFEGLLKDARLLMDQFEVARAGDQDQPRLVHVATDGETFGHHHKFGEMAVAHALRGLATYRGFTVTNYGQHLERHPPTYEVEIKPGTAWSCTHGLGRWKEDCGCKTRGEKAWNQQWRAPLRKAMERLNDSLTSLFEEHGPRYLREPWEARNDYIDLFLEPAPGSHDRFFSRHGRCPVDSRNRQAALRLLEMQRQAMLMFSSCGWFFSDISGVETIQIMRHAARAMDLAGTFSNADLMGPHVRELARARSNLPEKGSGAKIFEQYALPAAQGRDRLIFSHAARLSLRPESSAAAEGWLRIHRHRLRRVRKGEVSLTISKWRLKDEFLEESVEYGSAILRKGLKDIQGIVKQLSTEEEWADIDRKLQNRFTGGLELEAVPGAATYSWEDMPHALKEELAAYIARSASRSAEEAALKAYDAALSNLRALRELSIPVDRHLSGFLAVATRAAIRETIRGAPSLSDPEVKSRLHELISQAVPTGLELEFEDLREYLDMKLKTRLRNLATAISQKEIQEIEAILAVAGSLGLILGSRLHESYLYEFLSSPRFRELEAPLARRLAAIAEKLNLATARFYPRPGRKEKRKA